MKSNRLEQIRDLLISPNNELEIQLDDTTITAAKTSLNNMFKYA